MTRDTGAHKGEGRDWRLAELTEPRRKMLRQMRDGSEWHALQLSKATGVAYATVYQSLKAFQKLGWATSRLEPQAEHRARKTGADAGSKGPRRTYWRLTADGRDVARLA